MTDQELEHVRQVLRQELTASEQRLREEITGAFRQEIAATEQRLREEIAATGQRLREEITGAFRQEIAATEQRLREEIAATEQRLREEIAATEQRVTAATTANLSDLRSELLQQIQQIRRELESNTLHLDRIDTRLAALALEVSGISKARDASERLDREMLSTQSAQQRAIDELTRSLRDLSARVTRLEEAIRH
jgi:chromosome segregation ATPase